MGLHTHQLMTTRRIVLPERFYRDHADRGLPAGVIVSERRATVTVDLDDEAWKDLRADAEHYVYMGVAEMGVGLLGLISSARATLKRMAEYDAAEAGERENG